MSEAILSTQSLGRSFRVKGPDGPALLQALADIEISVPPGHSLGVLGESGCGKTTLARLLLGLDRPSEGAVLWRGQDVAGLRGAARLAYRREVQPVFQNPFSSLDPRMRVRRIIAEPLQAAARMSRAEVAARVAEVLKAVGLNPEDGRRFPNEFSGGQRQRIAIARAIASRPALLLLDEPVSSQDISIRAQILNILKDLQRDGGMASIFVSHDLATVRFMCDEVVVIYLGRIVERGPAAKICTAPDHPYSRALLAAALPADPQAPPPDVPPIGEIPSPIAPPSGCPYHPRCPFAKEVCARERPALRETASGAAACHMVHAEEW